MRRDAEHQPADVKTLALALPPDAWTILTWREGSNDDMTWRFARVRVRPAPRDEKSTEPRPEEWPLVEWPQGETEPTKYWFSTLPEDMSFVEMVDLTKLRWRIERDCQDVGLGHYEGRGWRGFHHHATLCITAFEFLISERETIPPSGPRPVPGFQKPAVSRGPRSRSAPRFAQNGTSPVPTPHCEDA